MAPPTVRLAFYLTREHPCGYLPGEQGATLLAVPEGEMDPWIYQELMAQGFRRSGAHVYRPHCPACSRCIPVRIPVDRFHMSRNLHKIWNRNADLTVIQRPVVFDPEHFDLYRRYLASRHAGGPMDDPSEADYTDFLTAPWMATRFVEFRLAGRLVMVAVTDAMYTALSALYTFFDPDLASRSLGTHAILWQIQEARREYLSWLYLGYWVSDCRKMAYKIRFRPIEGLLEEGWRVLTPEHRRTPPRGYRRLPYF